MKKILVLLALTLLASCDSANDKRALAEYKKEQRGEIKSAEPQKEVKTPVAEFGECTSGDGVYFVKSYGKDKDGFLDYKNKTSIPRKLVDSLNMEHASTYDSDAITDSLEMIVFLLPDSNSDGLEKYQNLVVSISPNNTPDSDAGVNYNRGMIETEKRLSKVLEERCNYKNKFHLSGIYYNHTFDDFTYYEFDSEGNLAYEGEYKGKFHRNMHGNTFFAKNTQVSYSYMKNGYAFWKIEGYGRDRFNPDSSFGTYYTPTGKPFAKYRCLNGTCEPLECIASGKIVTGKKTKYDRFSDYLSYIHEACNGSYARYDLYDDTGFVNNF